MPQHHAGVNRTANRPDNFVAEAFHLRIAAGMVAALFFLLAECNVIRAADIRTYGIRVFRFSCEFRLGTGHGRLDGLMATDGVQHRIIVYWIEPDVFRERDSFVRYSDFFFTPEEVHYWLYPSVQHRTFRLFSNNATPLIPETNSPEAVVRAGLDVVRCMEVEDGPGRSSLEVTRFFKRSRRQARYSNEASPSEADGNDLSISPGSDVWDLATVPVKRHYTKERRPDGVFLWHAATPPLAQPVAIVAVKPVDAIQQDDHPGVFDANTLGRWHFVPEPYRAYWSFDLAYSQLNDLLDDGVASRTLYDRIQAYLDGTNLPNELSRGIHRLWWKVALRSDDVDRLQRSVRATVDGLCADVALSKYRILVESARISGEVQKQHPEDHQEWFRVSVGPVVGYIGRDIAQHLDRLMPILHANKWYTFARLLFDEVRSQGLMEETRLTQAVAQFDTTRLAREVGPSDPCEPYARVREYLAHLDAECARGTIGLSNLRHILAKGLEGRYRGRDASAHTCAVERTVRLVHTILGDGPFRGDEERLEASIAAFSERCIGIHGRAEPIETVLATFLALSFCDTSTAEDHSIFFSQIETVSTDLQNQINTMLAEYALSSLMTPADVKAICEKQEQLLRTYLNDPLWAPFKFPLSHNEQIRLGAKLQLQVMQARPSFDEIAIMVQYAGPNADLSRRMAREITRVAEHLLSETAFLRRPPYLGVSCHYRTALGLTAMIEGPLYEEGNCPKEIFKAMKYFHLGHRLEDVVRRQQEVDAVQESSQ